MLLSCCGFFFFCVCQDIISNEFYFPVTLRCHYFEIFQNWWKVFTVKKYYLLKAVFFFCLEVVHLLMLHTTPEISERGRLLAEPGNPGEAQGDDSRRVALLPDAQQLKITFTIFRERTTLTIITRLLSQGCRLLAAVCQNRLPTASQFLL